MYCTLMYLFRELLPTGTLTDVRNSIQDLINDRKMNDKIIKHYSPLLIAANSSAVPASRCLQVIIDTRYWSSNFASLQFAHAIYCSRNSLLADFIYKWNRAMFVSCRRLKHSEGTIVNENSLYGCAREYCVGVRSYDRCHTRCRALKSDLIDA